MPRNRLIFEAATKYRDTITKEQQRRIAELYYEWSKEIGRRGDWYANQKSSSSRLSEYQMRDLKKMLEESGNEVAKQIEKGIKDAIYTVSDKVVKSNTAWLVNIGFPNTKAIAGAYSHVPDMIVKRLITGKIYKSGWSLSKRIWGPHNETQKQLYEIVAGGIAKNQSIYVISKQLEKYVSPRAAKQWNLTMKDGRKIYPKMIDYNAQRLARTLSQHSYQQSFIAVTENNPLVIKYQWLANGSRACDLCLERNGAIFLKGDLPMDHPNGMCTMIPVVATDYTNRLAKWFRSPRGTDRAMDKFAKDLGYDE